MTQNLRGKIFWLLLEDSAYLQKIYKNQQKNKNTAWCKLKWRILITGFFHSFFFNILKTMTALDPNTAKFAFPQYLDLISLLDYVDIVLKFVCLW